MGRAHVAPSVLVADGYEDTRESDGAAERAGRGAFFTKPMLPDARLRGIERFMGAA